MIPDLTVARVTYQTPLKARSHISPGRRTRPRLTERRRHPCTLIIACFLLFNIMACRQQPETVGGETTITVIGFSILQEALDNEIFPAFVKEWKEKTGQKVTFVSTFNGSEMATNQILHGFKVDLAILAIE